MSNALNMIPGERIEVLQPRFRLIPFNQLNPRLDQEYLVKGIIPRTGLTLVWGPPKSGKSFWAFDVMMHVALGWNYRKRPVYQGAVIYCAFEGWEGIAKRVEAFRTRRLAEDVENIPFFLIATQLDLAKDHEALIRSIRVQLPAGQVPAAVVLDTLNRSLAGSESSDVDMAGYIRAADAIRAAFGCAVIVVHHCGLEGNRPRGHSSLTGAVDAQLAVRRDDANNVVVVVEWMKDGPEGDIVVSKLESVEIGADQDGDPVTSCVITEVEPGKFIMPAAKPKHSGAALTALRALEKAIEEVGVPATDADRVPADTKTVTVAQWREYAYACGITISSESRARQQAFKRAHDRLVNLRDVEVWNDIVWIPRDHG